MHLIIYFAYHALFYSYLFILVISLPGLEKDVMLPRFNHGFHKISTICCGKIMQKVSPLNIIECSNSLFMVVAPFIYLLEEFCNTFPQKLLKLKIAPFFMSAPSLAQPQPKTQSSSIPTQPYLTLV